MATASEVPTAMATEATGLQHQQTLDYLIKQESTTPKLDTSKWLQLLKHYDKLNVKTSHYNPHPCRLGRTLSSPSLGMSGWASSTWTSQPTPSLHEVMAWIKRILRVDKIGHMGTLEPKVTGNLIVCIDHANRSGHTHHLDCHPPSIIMCRLLGWLLWAASRRLLLHMSDCSHLGLLSIA